MLSIFRKSGADVGIGENAACGSKRRRLFLLKSSFLGGGRADGEEEEVPEPKLQVSKVSGDGRCMFRSVARGLALLSGEELSEENERTDADKLRLRVCECIRVEKKDWFDEMGLLEESVDTYCKRMESPDFYGGEPELFLLSELLQKSIFVYLQGNSEEDHFKLLEYKSDAENGNGVIRLLYNGRNHYDFLQPITT